MPTKTKFSRLIEEKLFPDIQKCIIHNAAHLIRNYFMQISIKNSTYNESIKADSQVINMMEIVGKNFKVGIINMLCI